MFSLIITLVFIIFAIVFAVQNSDVVDVQFFFWKLSWPLAFIVLIFFALGLAIGLLAVLPTVVCKHRKLAHER